MKPWMVQILLVVGCGSPADTDTETDMGDTEPPTDGVPTDDTAEDPTTPPDTDVPTTTDSGTVPSEPTTWEGGPLLPDPVVSGACDYYAVESWLNPARTTPELHLFGIYESYGGAVTIEVDRSYTNMVLVFSAYEQTAWTIRYDPDLTTVDRVVLNGYNTQTVTFESTTAAPLVPPPVDDRSPYSSSFGSFPFSTQGGYYLNETIAFIGDLEAHTGLVATSFWGCYGSGGFRLQ